MNLSDRLLALSKRAPFCLHVNANSPRLYLATGRDVLERAYVRYGNDLEHVLTQCEEASGVLPKVAKVAGSEWAGAAKHWKRNPGDGQK